MTKLPAAVALGKLGGAARAKKLTAKKRREIASKGGLAAQENITTDERIRRAKEAWKTRRAAQAEKS